jgi:hypothetical protein
LLDRRFDYRLDYRFDHRCSDGKLDWRLDNLRDCFRGVIAGFPLDQNTLLAHLDLNGPGTAMGVGRLDFRRLLAGQRDLGLRLVTMRPAQVFEQLGLVLIGKLIGGSLLADTGLVQLLKQGRLRHLEFDDELRNSCCGHTCYPPAHSNQ